MHSMLNLEEDGVQQQKSSSGFTPLSHEQESEAAVGTGSAILDSGKVGKESFCRVTFAGTLSHIFFCLKGHMTDLELNINIFERWINEGVLQSALNEHLLLQGVNEF